MMRLMSFEICVVLVNAEIYFLSHKKFGSFSILNMHSDLLCFDTYFEGHFKKGTTFHVVMPVGY